MALDTIDDIRDKLRASYRPELYTDLYNNLAWVTDTSIVGASLNIGDNFPIWPHMKPRRVYEYDPVDEQGTLPASRLRDTFNAVTMMLAKLRIANIKPDFVDINSKIISSARASYWSKRCTGSATIPGWTESITAVAFDGLMAGYGVMQVGTNTNRLTGKKYVTVKRHRPLNVLLDPSAVYLSDSEWVCFVHIMDVDEAESYTGLKDLDRYEQGDRFTFSNWGSRKVVQVFEYFSFTNDVTDTPTRACIVGGMTSEAYKISKNEFGCLPVAFNEFLYVDGIEFPQGAVYLTQNLETQMDAYRKRLQQVAELHNIVAFNPDGISVSDMRRIKDAIDGKGKMPDLITQRKKMEPGTKAFDEYKGASIPAGLEQLLQLAQGEFRAISGINELSRGESIPGANTATEVSLINRNSGAISGLGAFKLGLFGNDLIQKVCFIAREFEQDTLTINADGTNVVMNDPNVPALSAANLFKDDSTVLIAEEEMFGSANDQKNQHRIAELQGFIGLPGVNVIEVTKEIARLMKLDVSTMVQSQMAPQDASGMPAQPIPGGPPQGMAQDAPLPMSA